MSKKAKITLISIISILLVLAFTKFIFFTDIRGDFIKYLKEKYSDQSFGVERGKKSLETIGDWNRNLLRNQYSRANC